MKQLLQSLFFALAALLLVGMEGCVKQLPLPNLKGLRKMVLLGEIAAGDSLSLRLGQSVPVTQSTTGLPQWPANVEARVFGGGLLLSQCYPRADTFTPALGTLVIKDEARISPGVQYSVQVTGSGFPDVEALVPVPSPFTVALTDTQTVSYNGITALAITFRIYDRGSEKNWYVFEALRHNLKIQGTFEFKGSNYDVELYYSLYDSLMRAGVKPPSNIISAALQGPERLITYTTDGATENAKLATAFTPAKRVLLDDASFAGNSYDLKVLVDQSRFASTAPYDLGQITFYMKSVSEDYFKYLRSYETFTPANSGGFLSQPVRIEGNVKGGYGVVGGVFPVAFPYRFGKWPF